MITECIEWQDERKKHIFITLHFIDLLLQEVAKRFVYSFRELHDLWYFEVSNILKGEDLRPTLNRRAFGFGFQFFHDCRELTSEETNSLWNMFDSHDGVPTDRLKGVVASKGSGKTLTARVRILLDPLDVETFQEKEALIAPMTSPEYIFAMRKASAVITDTGGLTSHAAIVSRELGIPCIVGTKAATKILKDGDMVEIDVATGIVKKI